VRYYIDGEATASIAFKPPLATGVGFDDLALWGNEKASDGAKKGGWSVLQAVWAVADDTVGVDLAESVEPTLREPLRPVLTPTGH
jgi:hypothetical protein